MAEYTDKTALVEKIANIRVHVAAARQSGKSLAGEVLHMYRDAVLEAIREAPDADVVEVVRCKDCRHSALTSIDGVLYCFKANNTVKREDFCSYGEKREATDGPT